MWNVVLGFLALAGSAVRDGQGINDLGRSRSDEAMSVFEPASTMTMAELEEAVGVVDARSVAPSDNDWDVACERKRGGELVFDRKSVREMGGATLVRWSTTETTPDAGVGIYTAVVDCRAKTIEATWPGRRTATRAGSCGRHLVDAVCATRWHRAAR